MKAILAKLYAVSCDIEYLKKDKTNAFHKYRYASEEAIKKAVYPLFEKHRVIFRLKEVKNVDLVTHGDSILTSSINVFEFLDVDSGESLTTEILSQGDDKNDKGSYKNHTGGLKYALTTTFGIVTGDDAEDDGKSDKGAQKAATQTVKNDITEDAVITKLRVDMAAVDFSAKRIGESVQFYNEHPDKEAAIKTLYEAIDKKKEKNSAAAPNAV